ncbi:antibiotic biosynthesis monooxygenase [Alphaproteobacteria bacterium]|nr:antibiotic biosynthesis monooxygenase [Alphaproteobacteria bacterium]MDC0147805.1 antibiotic biosynthesis monooxygenase [Alphaproteobacteria bacterium]
MSVLVTVTFQFKPEAAEMALEALRQALPDTRAYAGCESVDSYYDSATCTLLLIEFWDKPESQQAYLAWRGETGSMDAMADAMAAAPIFTTYETRKDI